MQKFLKYDRKYGNVIVFNGQCSKILGFFSYTCQEHVFLLLWLEYALRQGSNVRSREKQNEDQTEDLQICMLLFSAQRLYFF